MCIRDRLFTACEERGLVGAKALNPQWLEGFRYYINLDAFRGDAAIIASAGGLRQACLLYTSQLMVLFYHPWAEKQ